MGLVEQDVVGNVTNPCVHVVCDVVWSRLKHSRLLRVAPNERNLSNFLNACQHGPLSTILPLSDFVCMLLLLHICLSHDLAKSNRTSQSVRII